MLMEDRILGRRLGSVTSKKLRTGLAPRFSAASPRVWLMELINASTK